MGKKLDYWKTNYQKHVFFKKFDIKNNITKNITFTALKGSLGEEREKVQKRLKRWGKKKNQE